MTGLLTGLLDRRETRRPGLSTTTTHAEAIYLPSAEPGLGTSGVLIGKELSPGRAWSTTRSTCTAISCPDPTRSSSATSGTASRR